MSRAQEIDITATEVIDPGMVREQAETFAGNQMSRVGQQHFNTGPDLDRRR